MMKFEKVEISVKKCLQAGFRSRISRRFRKTGQKNVLTTEKTRNFENLSKISQIGQIDQPLGPENCEKNSKFEIILKTAKT